MFLLFYIKFYWCFGLKDFTFLELLVEAFFIFLIQHFFVFPSPLILKIAFLFLICTLFALLCQVLFIVWFCFCYVAKKKLC